LDIEFTFRGTFPCAVDQKRRLTVPSRFAKALTPRAKRTFVAVHGLERCLSLYPLDFWQTFEKNMLMAEISDPVTRRGIRKLLASTEDLPMDNQNRVTLTPALLDYARIKHDALLNGVIDRLELWSPERWNEFNEEPGSPSLEEAFTRLGPILNQTARQISEERERLTGHGDNSTET
jgi:MraZ protein